MLAVDILRETITDIRNNRNAFAFSGISVISKSAGTSPSYNQFKKKNINHLRVSLPLLITYLATFKYSN